MSTAKYSKAGPLTHLHMHTLCMYVHCTMYIHGVGYISTTKYSNAGPLTHLHMHTLCMYIVHTYTE